MQLKDATRSFGSVGFLLALFLIFLIADSAYACPGHQSKVVYRTRVINRVPTTVITYGGPASYRGCSDTTKRVKYVAVRGDSYHDSPRYVVARSSDNYYPTRKVRYVSVRNADTDAPRYMVVRRQPAYVQRQAKVFVVKDADIDDASRYIPVERYSTGTRYVAVRSGYRTGNGIVAYVDRDDASPRYVTVRRTPVYSQTRYVAVRDDDDDYVRPARYVAVRNVRNACACADELSSRLDQIETRTPGHVVVKSDYIDGTEDVVYRGEVVNDTYAINNVNYDDDDLYPVSPAVRTNYVGYHETVVPARVAYVPASNIAYDDTSEMSVSYVPAATYDDSDYDDQAIFDSNNVTYVADNDIDDACLSTVAVQASMENMARTVSYVPVADIDDDDSSDVSMLYGWDDGSDSAIATVPVVNNGFVDTGTTYVVADDMSNSCLCPMTTSSLDDDVDVDTVSYVPASYVNDMDPETVSYVPVDDVDVDTVSYLPASDIETSTVSYVPENAMGAETVSYVPAESVEHVAVADMSADDTSMAVAAVGVPVVDGTAMAAIDKNETVPVAEMVATQQAAGEVGFNDGLADGRNAAMNLDQNLPVNSANFQMATNGYSDTISDAQIFQDAYRSSYLQGFSEGYNSVINAG